MIKEKGITLIALIVTIVVLLILAGVSISLLTGENGIIGHAKKAKFITEIEEIQEKINLKELEEEDVKFGTVNGILGKASSYNEKLVVENGKLAYNPEKITEEEKKWLEEIGIVAKSNYYLIMMENTKAKYTGQTNIGTIEEFKNLVNSGNFNYDIAYIIENITIQEENWTPIGNTEGNKFTKTLEGNNYIIKGLKIDRASDNQGLFGYNAGNIKDIIIENANIKGKNYVGGLVGREQGGTIENIEISEGTITGNYCVGGIIGRGENTTIDHCSNNGVIIGNGNDVADVNGMYHAEVGGIAGGVNPGKIKNCHNHNTVKSTRGICIGGITGSAYNKSLIYECYNEGTIGALQKDIQEQNIGGICGDIRK